MLPAPRVAPSDTPTSAAEPVGSLDDSFARQLRQQARTPIPPLQLGDVLDRKYRLVRVLGQGGMGIVYEAEHVDAADLRYAIKTILPNFVEEFSEHFLREARSIAAIRQQHVIRISDVGRTSADIPYMVMEYHGGDLGKYVRERGGTLPADEALELCAQVCDALVATHNKRIVHRDIKPGNCLIQQEDNRLRIILSDFGLARVLHGEDSVQSEWTIAGSRGYMAPECYTGRPRPDHRVDIYSVGAMLFCLLTGSSPSLNQFQSSEFKQDPTCGGKLPPALLPIVERAVAIDPNQRYASAEALGSALRQARTSLAPTRQGWRLSALAFATLCSLVIVAVTAYQALLATHDSPIDPPTVVPPNPAPVEPGKSVPVAPEPKPPIADLIPEPKPPIKDPTPELPLPEPVPPTKTTKTTTPRAPTRIKAATLLSQVCATAEQTCAAKSDLKKNELYLTKPIRATLRFQPSARPTITNLGLLGKDDGFRKCIDRILKDHLKDKQITDPGAPEFTCNISL